MINITSCDTKAGSCFDFSSLGNKRSRMAMVGIAVMLGWAGCHKYYLGKWALGLTYLVFSLTGLAGFAMLGWAIITAEHPLTVAQLKPQLLMAALFFAPLITSLAEAVYWLFQPDKVFDAYHKRN